MAKEKPAALEDKREMGANRKARKDEEADGREQLRGQFGGSAEGVFGDCTQRSANGNDVIQIRNDLAPGLGAVVGFRRMLKR